MNRHEARWRVGTSGWQYRHWKDVFYPSELKQAEWFPYYARHFDTIEINNTFYGLPTGETVDTWRERAPEGFCYVLKFSRYGTHIKRLKDPDQSIGVFLDRAERLGDRLGPILVQLPPRFDVDTARLSAFLDAAPERHRWAVEFRNPTWLCEDVYGVLREHNAALCVHDMLDDHPRVATADWVYLRFHGGPDGDYTHQALTAVAGRVRDHLEAGRDVYVYFNNDLHGNAVRNALDLRRYIEGSATTLTQ
ncbi:MAG: DUF72 domain-containing protein [Planctomycetota bacterium]